MRPFSARSARHAGVERILDATRLAALLVASACGDAHYISLGSNDSAVSLPPGGTGGEQRGASGP
ncbi:MAG TPA: hypothetical protein VMG12_17135, partial [Polyangiaceae bacterium]|nr:hypothetical protein [Polyangiaceae bacterium]